MQFAQDYNTSYKWPNYKNKRVRVTNEIVKL